MGTRYEDQPPEHWAGPESLDPTPVWRQFLVFGILAFSALGIIAVVSYLALAPMFVTPPAVVPGGRLVLSLSEYSAPGATVRVGAPVLDEQEAVWIVRVCDAAGICPADEFFGLSAWWVDPATGSRCPVVQNQPTVPPGTIVAPWIAVGDCASARRTFGPRGQPVSAPRGLDRYLVSVEGERVIVNLSREIRGVGATPQPMVSPLATPVQTRRP